MLDIPIALHIPDGFLSGGVRWPAACWRSPRWPSAAGRERGARRGARPAARRARRVHLRRADAQLPDRRRDERPLPGRPLAAVLLGPWLACLVMAVVIAVQAFAFADGGITALGANVLNMGVLGALLAGSRSRRAVRVLPHTRVGFLGVVGVVAWLAVMVGRRRDQRRARRSRTRSRSPPRCRRCSACTR